MCHSVLFCKCDSTNIRSHAILDFGNLNITFKSLSTDEVFQMLLVSTQHPAVSSSNSAIYKFLQACVSIFDGSNEINEKHLIAFWQLGNSFLLGIFREIFTLKFQCIVEIFSHITDFFIAA